MVISMLKIRRPLGRLIFNTGIAIPGKTVFLIEMAPWYQAITNHDKIKFLGHIVVSLGFGKYTFYHMPGTGIADGFRE